MEIAAMPYEEGFQSEVRGLEVTDPQFKEFSSKLEGHEKRKVETMLFMKHREILSNITQYSEDQILQFSAVMLKSSNCLNLHAGTLMKEWYKQKKDTAKNIGDVESGISNQTTEVLK